MRHLLLTAVLLTPFASQAELIVVADLGGKSTTEYFAGINNQEDGNTRAASPHVKALPASPVGVEYVLPVNTLELSPGEVESQSLHLPGMRATFLIGDDDLSRRWLTLRHDQLLQLNAVGFVVNVVSESALHDLQSLASGLELVPVPASDLAKRLNLNHYPVLISEKGLEQ